MDEKLSEKDIEIQYKKIEDIMKRAKKKNRWEDPAFVEEMIQMVSLANEMQEYIKNNHDKIEKETESNELKKIEHLIKIKAEFTILYTRHPAFFYYAMNGELFSGEHGEILAKVMKNSGDASKVKEILQDNAKNQMAKILKKKEDYINQKG